MLLFKINWEIEEIEEDYKEILSDMKVIGSWGNHNQILTLI